MVRLALRRLLVLLVALFTVSVVTFLIPYASSDDPARTILRSRVSS